MRIWAVATAFITSTAIFTGFWLIQNNGLTPHPRSRFSCEDCNLLIVSLSNLRRSHLGLYGSKTQASPNIDDFFSSASIFESVYAPASLTYTVAPSLFYSLFPEKHQLMSRKSVEISQKVLSTHQSITQILKQRGYHTAAFVSDEDYAYRYGIGKDFQLYFDSSRYRESDIVYQPRSYSIGVRELLPPARNWLNENRDKKFFLFLQSYDLHCPYNAEKQYRKKFDPEYNGSLNIDDCHMNTAPLAQDNQIKEWPYPFDQIFSLESWFQFSIRKDSKIELSGRDLYHLKKNYDAELYQTDQRLAALFDHLESLGMLDRTIVVLLSEHGDYLGENGYFMKASLSAEGNLHNQNIGQVLAVRHPSMSSGVRHNTLMHTVDIAPTLLQMLDSSIEKLGQGHSVLAEIEGEEPVNRFVYSGSTRTRQYRTPSPISIRAEALQDRRWKLLKESRIDPQSGEILRSQVMLYDLLTDPSEKKDVSSENLSITQKMASQIRQFRNKILSSEN